MPTTAPKPSPIMPTLNDDEFLDAFSADPEAVAGHWSHKATPEQIESELLWSAFEGKTTGAIGHA